jgi:hypothetical protein
MQDSFSMLWLLAPVPLIAGFFVAYRLSPASAASKRASKAVAALESLDSELKKQRQDIDSSLSQAASNYIQEVQVGRLRSIQLDELKRHASGMRLQALKDVGIRTLADLRGWNEGCRVALKSRNFRTMVDFRHLNRVRRWPHCA